MPAKAPQTPAALNSMRHLFSAAAAAPPTPDMQGLSSMLDASPSKAPKYGTLGDRMRASPEANELLSPSKSSPRKKVTLGSSPEKARRGVRRSHAAEVAVPVFSSPAKTSVPAPVPASPVATAPEQPAYEAELQVTVFDATAMDAQNEALAQALTEAEETDEAFAVTPVISEVILEEPAVEKEPADSPQLSDEAMPVVERNPSRSPRGHEAGPEAAPAPVAAEEAQVEVAAVEQPEPVDLSPSKTRASRRAASASPTKRTARSASPTKRAPQSSPVKRAAAAEVFAEETVPEVVEDAAAIVEEAQPEETAAEPGPASPAKPSRRTGGRKAKQAATEAISATL